MLDPRFFTAPPPVGSPRPGILQANWPADFTDAAKEKSDLPARLFGTTTLNSFELIFDSESDVMVYAGDVKPETDTPLHRIIRFQAHVNVDAAGNTWWWEGFIRAQIPKPIIVKAREKPDDPNHDIGLGIFMPGDAWLMAGSPRVSEKATIGELGTLFTDFSDGGPMRVEMPWPAPSVSSTTTSQPALAAYFITALRKAGLERPMVVYAWAGPPRALFASWHEQDGKPFGDSWSKPGKPLLPATPQSPVPGLRGIIWWHGEWEAERGDFSPANSRGPAADAFTVDLENFRQRYASESVKFADSVRKEFARWPGAPTPSGERVQRAARKMFWIVMQAPAVARQPPFLTEFLPDFEEIQSPLLSPWSALRAAQYEAVRHLQDTSYTSVTGNEFIGPRAFLVPLIGDVSLEPNSTNRSLRDPGWLWTGELDAKRFLQAGQRIADQLAPYLVNQPSPPQDKASSASAGMPQVTWHGDNSPRLDLIGVATVTGDDSAAQFEVFINGKWDTCEVNPKATLPLVLGTGVTGVRYAWGDSPGLLRVMDFKSGNVPLSKPLPLPPFLLTAP